MDDVVAFLVQREKGPLMAWLFTPGQIALVLAQKRAHHLRHFWRNRSARIVVEINRLHGVVVALRAKRK